MATLVSDGIDFRLNKVMRQGHFLMMREYVQQEECTLINIDAPNEGPAKYLKQLLIYLKKRHL